MGGKEEGCCAADAAGGACYEGCFAGEGMGAWVGIIVRRGEMRGQRAGSVVT